MQWNAASRCKFDGKSVATETTSCSGCPDGWKAIVEQILASEEEISPKEQDYENRSLGSE